MASYFFFFSLIGSFLVSILFFLCFGRKGFNGVFYNSLAMGLLALCEYVEQKPNFLKRIVKRIIFMIAAAHFGFILFDRISFWRLIISLAILALHYRLHLDLPKIPLVPAVVNIAFTFVNHFIWLSYFFKNHHPLWEVITFYFFIVWTVPISIAISYSTSELLPGFYEIHNNHKRSY